MAKQTLIWTALPNGFDAAGDLRISALVSPRLEPDGDQILKPFGDFLDWPETLRGAEFTLRYGGQTQVIPGNQTAGPARVDTLIDAAHSPTWSELLHDNTPVIGFHFQDLTSVSVLSYDTVALNSLARVLYSSLAKAASDSLPKVSQIFGDTRWQRFIDAVAFLDRVFVEENTGLRDTTRQFEQFQAGKLTFQDPIATLLAHVQLFHTPPSAPESQDYSASSLPPDDPRILSKTAWRTFKRAALPAATDFVTTIDFHQIVAAMSSYPRLLRRLGLVVDFVVPRAQFTPSADASLSVTCDIPSPNDGVTRLSSSNTTHVRLSASQFVAVSKSTADPDDLRVIDGLLHLKPEQFGVLQADVDATGLKLMNFARTLWKMLDALPLQADAVTKHEKQAGAPALRNAGLMLVHRRRANMLKSAFDANKKKDDALQLVLQNPQAAAPDLFAEDLVRGWRVDIWDDVSGKWRSLCERTSAHTIGSITVDDDREGMLRLGATKAADGANPNVLYLHEALMSWTGWSLVAPQPGRVVDKVDQVSDGGVEVPPGLPMKSVFTARSLPRLRYGRSYRIRARMADLAANSLLPTENDFGPAQSATAAVKYCRFEPLQAPSLALVRDGGAIEAPAEGETMDRIAIRTFNVTPDINAVPTPHTARRHAVPARSTVREAELYGMLDAAGQVDGSAAMFTLLASKDAALAEVKLATAGPLDAGATIETVYAVLDAPATSIPYLPDPMCVEMAARILNHPGFPASSVIPVPAYTAGATWPHATPFTIRVLEDPAGTPHFNLTTRVLHIPLPKAVRATLLLSCRLLDSKPMGIWDWLPDADRATVAADAGNGRHWALTPWRTVELVHAVQKPLIAPEMKLALSRGLGSTSVDPRFTASCSLASTARIDLEAVWHEPDMGSTVDPMGADLPRRDHAFSVKITDPLSYRTKLDDPQAGGFPEHEIAGTDLITVGGNGDITVTKRHEFNDTRYRRIEYWLEATTRFREYMTTDILTKVEGNQRVPIDDNIKVIGPAVRTWVRSSAPPPAPGVLYVVPTFGWTTQKDAEGHQSRWRRGGGLRVYLDRPWNVTGYGEMLGVVLPPAGFADDPNTKPIGRPYKKFVTQWGNDPAWESPFVSGCTPASSNFPLARRQPDPTGAWLPAFAPPDEKEQIPGPFQCTALPHPSVALHDTTVRVDVAPHDVSYDSDRHLWYCDIDVNFGASYFPFVRLALARYQPGSEGGAHLSNIVLADFMSLAPDRWLSISRKPDPNIHGVTLYGYGFSDSSGHHEALHSASTPSGPGGRPQVPASVSAESIVEVWVEKLDPSRGEDFGWTREAGATVSTAVPVRPVLTLPTTATGRDLERRFATRAGTRTIDISHVQPVLLWPTLWQGTVTLPSARPAHARYRLVVAEYEEYLVDDLTPYNLTPSTKGRRLVFVDHVDLT